MSFEKQIIVFIGPEGSGKSSMARRLAETIFLPKISTGDIIRDLAQNDQGDLGEECRTILKLNSYLSPESFLKIMVNRLKKEDVAEGFILDGGMRTLKETEDFDAVLGEANLRIPLAVVYLQIPILTSFSRLVFDKNARKREDDTFFGVVARLSKFYFRFGKRLAIIRSQPGWRLVRVDASQPADRVFEDVLTVLSSV